MAFLTTNWSPKPTVHFLEVAKTLTFHGFVCSWYLMVDLDPVGFSIPFNKAKDNRNRTVDLSSTSEDLSGIKASTCTWKMYVEWSSSLETSGESLPLKIGVKIKQLQTHLY